MIRSPDERSQIDLPLGEAPHPTSAAAQALMAFLLRMRARGVADVGVLRALETTPRELFTPRRFADLALRDIALPIPRGQIMPEPYFIARALEALTVEPHHRVLEIGAGSGYSAAILSRLAREVVTIEYFDALARECAARLAQLHIKNVDVRAGEALALTPALGVFDRIIVHAVVEGLPDAVAGALAEGGVIVLARAGEGPRATLVRISHTPQSGFAETPVGSCRLGALIATVAREPTPAGRAA